LEWVKLQVEEIVRSLFTYTDGSVYFWEGEVQPDNVVRLLLPTRKLIAEGLSRRDELLRFLAALEDPNLEIDIIGDAAAGLSNNAHQLCDALREHRQFAVACRVTGIDVLTGARIIQMLRLARTVAIKRRSEEGVSSDSPGLGSHTSLRMLIESMTTLTSELTAPRVAADGPDEVFSRMTVLLEDTAARYPDLLGGVRLGLGGTLDHAQLEECARKITGDRESVVRRVHGEMVTYLEFDLRNHPRIEDPEMYPDAVEDLRAKLDL
jgi:hypothetical protein